MSSPYENAFSHRAIVSRFDGAECPICKGHVVVWSEPLVGVVGDHVVRLSCRDCPRSNDVDLASRLGVPMDQVYRHRHPHIRLSSRNKRWRPSEDVDLTVLASMSLVSLASRMSMSPCLSCLSGFVHYEAAGESLEYWCTVCDHPMGCEKKFYRT